MKKASKTASACNQRIVFEPLVQEAQSVRAPTGGSQDQITTNVDDATSQGTKRKERDGADAPAETADEPKIGVTLTEEERLARKEAKKQRKREAKRRT